MKYHFLTPLIIFLCVAVIFSLPVFHNFHHWGQMEWDQFTFWNAVPRETILTYQQFPLWNPYANGGNVLLAHPHSSFLSPFYIFVLIFGPVIGLKLEIIIHLIIGLGGMFFLSQYLSLNKISSYCASFVFMLSSLYALHLTEGHTEWLTMAFVPWMFLFYLKSFKETRHVLGAIVFFGLMLLGGSVDVVTVTTVFFSIYALLKLFELRQITPLITLCLIFGGTFLLCAVKLLPMLEFLDECSRLTRETSRIDLGVLRDMFFSREQAHLDSLDWDTTQNMGLAYGWHEYGAYIGVVPFSLYVYGSLRGFKKNWPLVLTGIISLLIAMGNQSPVDLWKILHNLPFYDSLRVPTRFVLGFVFSVAILSGVGLAYLEKDVLAKTPSIQAAPLSSYLVLIVLFVIFDLWQVDSPIFRSAFRIAPLAVERNSVFLQRYEYLNLHEENKFENIIGEKMSNSSMYPVFLSNSGILEGNEVIHVPKGEVKAIFDEEYQGEVYLAESQGQASFKYFSPNKITVDIKVHKPDTLVVNQNYYEGWKVNKSNQTEHAVSFQGLIATPVMPGDHTVTFYYRPLSFLAGLSVTISFVLLVSLFYMKRLKFHS